MLQTSITRDDRGYGGGDSVAATIPGPRASASGGSAPRRASPSCLSLLACGASLLLGACALADRPFWEQAVVMRSPPPPASASRPERTGTTAAKVGTSAEQLKTAPPRSTSRAAARRNDLPAPGRPAKSNAQAAWATPTGTTGKAVAALAPLHETPGHTTDPAWIGVDTRNTRHEDTLLDLAVEHDLGFIELAMANPGVDPWLPGEGTAIVLPKMHLPPDAPHRGIVLNLPEQRLYHYEKGRLLRSYPVGIGRDGHATPTGSTTIVRKQANPTWYPTASARQDDPTLPAAVPPGPDNPLGNRAMYLGWSNYLIHGTNKEFGIGRRASRGCIRMYSDDAAALYDRVSNGTPVTVVNQPIKIGWLDKELYIEASPTISQVRQWEENGKFDPAAAGDVRRLVLHNAGAEAGRIDWAAVDRAVHKRRGIVTRITNPIAAPVMASAAKSDGANDSSGFVKWLSRQLSLDGD
jgi:L,D-transpeptidase ErfK/SrfK